jgi:two-component system sensor histidine kinase QseC
MKGAMTSIRFVLLAGTMAVLVAVLGAAAWIAYEAGEHEAEELFDARLATFARVLEGMVARQFETATVASPVVIALPEPVAAAADDEPSPLGHPYETKVSFQLRDSDGRLLARSSSAPIAPLAPLVQGYSSVGGWRVFSLRSGRSWVQVADSDSARGELSAKIAGATLMPLLAGMLLVMVLLSLLIRQGLAPLSQLTTRIAARDPGSTDAVRLERAPREIAPVLEALNGLLERMHAMLERERRFTADAAHELRTPLAALQVHAQNAARAATEAERRSSMDQLLEGLDRTIRMANQMLALSRASAAKAPFREVRLREVVQTAARQLGIAVPIAGDASIRGDPDQLVGLATNLLDNAVRHGGGAPRVHLEGGAMAVEDEGPGIPDAERERVFESYYRIAGSSGPGSGLGLAIAREIARQHGGAVTLEHGAGGRGTRVTVSFGDAARGRRPSLG